MQEAELYNLWEYYYNCGQPIQWQGNCLRILQTGVLNEHSGPDYRFARFELNGVVFQGSVEFHIDINDWYRHNHQYDPAYSDVVLHVLANPPRGKKTVTHTVSGRDIPTFVLPKPRHRSGGKCSATDKLSPEQTRHILQGLSLSRLDQKTSSFATALKISSEHTLFYHGFMRTMGYPFNKSAFSMLASHIPAHIYETYKDRPLILMALYFGCAGFLQGTFTDLFAIRLQKLFLHFESVLSQACLNKEHWQMAAVRPLNHPHFRIAAWVAFLVSLQQAPFKILYHYLEQRLDYRTAYHGLQQIMSLKPGGYWQEHYALDRPLKQKKNRVFLGKSRINELLSNVIIPLAAAKAVKNNNQGFVSYLREMYLQMPGRCNYSSLFRKNPWFREYQNIWSSCNTGQALLYLSDVYCTKNQCSLCPLKRKKRHSLRLF